MPTPSWPRDGLLGSAALLLTLLAGNACAHDVDPSAIPETGVRIGGGIAAAFADARERLPAAFLPGVIGTGQPPQDSRGLRLEHAVGEISGRNAFGLGGQFAVGLHDRDRPHVESAWVDMRLWDGGLYLGGGRNTVPTTPALGRAGHFDRFGLMPLAKRALFEGNWTEDGIALAWRPRDGADGAWPDRMNLGLWRGKAFPAGGTSPSSIGDRPITVGIGWNLGNAIEADFFAARMRPTARGSLVQSNDAGHTHGSPTCDTTLTGRVCFDGRVDLVGGTLSWEPLPDWSVSGTAVLRDERGNLYSSGGDTRYEGRLGAWWIDAAWRPAAAWEVAARVERLSATHTLEGPGASLVAQDAGLIANAPSRRLSAALTWSGVPGWRLSVEGGDDRTAGVANPYAMLRAVWLFDTAWR